MLSLLLNPIIRMVLLSSLVLGAIGAIYLKGRSDASSELERKALKEQQNAVDRSLQVRRDTRTRDSPSRLYTNDGFRRD